MPSIRYGDPLRKLRSHTGRWQIFLYPELVASRPPRGGEARVRVVGATRDHSKQKPTPVRNECAPRRFTPRGPPIGELFADVERPDPRSLVVPHTQPPPILRILFDQIPPKATQCYSPSFLSPRAFFGYSLLSPGRERGSGRLILQRNQVCAHPLTRKHSPKKRTVTPPVPLHPFGAMVLEGRRQAVGLREPRPPPPQPPLGAAAQAAADGGFGSMPPAPDPSPPPNPTTMPRKDTQKHLRHHQPGKPSLPSPLLFHPPPTSPLPPPHAVGSVAWAR